MFAIVYIYYVYLKKTPASIQRFSRAKTNLLHCSVKLPTLIHLLKKIKSFLETTFSLENELRNGGKD